MSIIVIAHNIRSTHNVGSILRTCDGFGVKKVYATGYTPYPSQQHDTRLPHERDKLTRQIAKTALGAEQTMNNEYVAEPLGVIDYYKQQGFIIAALEQAPGSVALPSYRPPRDVVLVLGEEVRGIANEVLAVCDVALEIPMWGLKESFNVSVAAGIALYVLRTAVQHEGKERPR